MSLWAEHKEERREHILATARDLIREGGVDNLSMRHLARRARLSVATLYNLWGSKAEILSSLLGQLVERFDSELDAIAETDPIDRVSAVNAVITGTMTSDTPYYRPLVRASMELADPNFQPPITHRLARMIREAFEAGSRQGLFIGEGLPHLVARHANHGAIHAMRLWAWGALDDSTFQAQTLYGLTICMLALATEKSRPRLLRQLRDLEARLLAGQPAEAASPRPDEKLPKRREPKRLTLATGPGGRAGRRSSASRR